MSDLALEIRTAVMADLPALGSSLQRAFAQDPMMKFIFGSSEPSRSAFTWFMTAGARYGVRWGRVTTVGQPAVGAAVWLRPGESEMSPDRLAAAGFAAAPFELGIAAFLRLTAVMEYIEALHDRLAPEPHWYLMILGVDPEWQRKGLGGQLLRPVFAEAEKAELACYLETTAGENVSFYQSFGFQVAEQSVGPGGLKVWAMRREVGSKRSFARR